MTSYREVCAELRLEAANEVILDVATEVETEGTMDANLEWAAVSRLLICILQASSLL